MPCCGGEFDEEVDNESYTSLGGFKRNRSCTDRIPLIGMGIFFAILFVFIGIALVNGDVSRWINGYDDCGNICGKNNIKPANSPIPCFGEDMTDKKYLLTKFVKTGFANYTTKECVHDCKDAGGFILFLNRCFPKSDTSDENINVGSSVLMLVSEDFQQSYPQIIVASLFAVVLSVMFLFLLRYATAFVVWFTLIAIIGILIAATIYLWILYNQAASMVKNINDENVKQFALFGASMITAVTVIVLLLTIVFFKRIKLIIQLFKEAAKAVADMPLIILQPIWTFVALFIIYVCGAYFSMWISSYANLTKSYNGGSFYNKPDMYTYEPTSTSVFTMAINWFGILWMIQFVIGCQHYIIGGCVATWFFSRNRNELGSPILSNSTNLLKFHLGTVAFGSLIIALVELLKQFVRAVRTSLQRRQNIVTMFLLCILEGLIEWIEEMLKFFSRNAYIITSIYGYPFCKAGKKAFRLLVKNIFSVVAINSIGDYVLGFMKLFIVLFTSLIGYEMLRDKNLHYIGFPILAICLIAFFVAHCFITVFEMTIDTIFLCFCEDCEENDGLSKPYYMSKNLMEFVENSSKIMKTPWEAEQLEAWENGPKRVLIQGS